MVHVYKYTVVEYIIYNNIISHYDLCMLYVKLYVCHAPKYSIATEAHTYMIYDCMHSYSSYCRIIVTTVGDP